MRTVTGLFDDYDDASAAVSELERAGVPSSDISIVGSNADRRHGEDSDSNAAEGAGTGAGIGALVGGAGGLLTGLGLMAIPGVGPVVAAGWLAATAVGAAGGAVAGGAAGRLIGAMTRSGVSEEDANLYAEGVRRGGTLVTARVEDNPCRRRRPCSSGRAGSTPRNAARPIANRAGRASTRRRGPMRRKTLNRSGTGIAPQQFDVLTRQPGGMVCHAPVNALQELTWPENQIPPHHPPLPPFTTRSLFGEPAANCIRLLPARSPC